MSADAARVGWGRMIAAAAAAAAAVVALRLVLVRDLSQPNAEFLPEMVRGPALEPQSARAPTSDGLGDQPPVAGVVIRGRLPFRYGTGPGEAKRAGAELANPFSSDDAAAVRRGAEVFANYCAVCHGPAGDGDGPAALRGMAQPPSFHAVRALEIKDGEMFHVVTLGQGNMASYSAQVEPDDRWKAILHVRALQKARKP
jgi:mono/diheme cytochrome c family protein